MADETIQTRDGREVGSGGVHTRDGREERRWEGIQTRGMTREEGGGR